jgi:uncharacterized protein (TIGR02266 family)
MSRVTVESQQGVQTGSERRRNQRADLIVRIDYSTVDEMFSEFTRDINEGGVFIETEKPQALGTEVKMHFNLPGGHERIETVGRVVRISGGEGSAVPGMGIEFEELAESDRLTIDRLVRALRLGGPLN